MPANDRVPSLVRNRRGSQHLEGAQTFASEKPSNFSLNVLDYVGIDLRRQAQMISAQAFASFGPPLCVWKRCCCRFKAAAATCVVYPLGVASRFLSSPA